MSVVVSVGHRWHDREQGYLKQLHDVAIRLSKEYMTLYIVTKRLQTKLRLPSIILSSCTGVASFGSTSFPQNAQRYVSIVVGIVNIGIAIIQTYESYLKVGDIVTASLLASTSFKKLADMIYCELFIPVEDRTTDGITFVRDSFHTYQTILEQCPPLEKEHQQLRSLAQAVTYQIQNDANYRDRSLFGRTFRPTAHEIASEATPRRSRLSAYIGGNRRRSSPGDISSQFAPLDTILSVTNQGHPFQS